MTIVPIGNPLNSKKPYMMKVYITGDIIFNKNFITSILLLKYFIIYIPTNMYFYDNLYLSLS